MGSELPEQSSAKARKRPAAKAAKLQDVGKVKSTLHLGLEASRRLTVHAAMLGMDRWPSSNNSSKKIYAASSSPTEADRMARLILARARAGEGRGGESAGSALGIF